MANVDFSTMPKSMQRLPIDPRGYPVPWFVAWVDGKPEFRAMDRSKWEAAIKRKLCWVCGEPFHNSSFTFVAGPMCGINRTSAEPPSHYSCAVWSAQNYPFFSKPHMVRREDELVNNEVLVNTAPGMVITRNPGVAMLWVTQRYRVFPVTNGYLIEMGDPKEVLWFAQGRPATAAEVDQSIETGLPRLQEVAAKEDGGLEALAKCIQRLAPWLPR